MRLPILLVALCLSAPSLGASTLSEAVDAAWDRDPRARAMPARADIQRARRAAADALFPEPPALGLGTRTDQFDRNAGARETEAELAFPLWLPGQRQARQDAAVAGREAAAGAALGLRLEIAGRVREAAWAVRLAETGRALAARRLELAADLERDVARRVQAGVLARMDLNTARGERLTAEAEHLRAGLDLADARSAWRVLTGLDDVPEALAEEPAAGVAEGGHPRLTAARQAATGAAADLAAVRASRRNPPELALLARRDRGALSDPYSGTVGLRVRIPFVLEGRAAQPMAEANAVLIEAEATLAQDVRAVEAETVQRRAELDTVRQSRALARSALEAAEDNHALAEKAFRLGELDLPALLRIRNAALAARLALARGDIELGRAVARHNQALGVLP